MKSSNPYGTQRSFCEITPGKPKAEELHEKITMRRMSTEMLILSLVIGVYMCRIERLESRSRRLQLRLAYAVARVCVLQCSSRYVL